MVTRTVSIEVNEIIDLMCCAEDYGYDDPVLMDAFYDWVSPLTDERIEEYARSFLAENRQQQGYTEEDADSARRRLRDIRARYRK